MRRDDFRYKGLRRYERWISHSFVAFVTVCGVICEQRFQILPADDREVYIGGGCLAGLTSLPVVEVPPSNVFTRHDRNRDLVKKRTNGLIPRSLKQE